MHAFRIDSSAQICCPSKHRDDATGTLTRSINAAGNKRITPKTIFDTARL